MIGSSVPLEIKDNKKLQRNLGEEGESNSAWLRRVTKDWSSTAGSLLLLGGNSLAHFRVRVAQSHLRFNLTPSYWSMVGVLTGEGALYSVPLELSEDISEVPHTNGVRKLELSAYDSADDFPNIAVIRLTDTPDLVLKYAEPMKFQRGLIDLPALVLSWLSYIWCVGKKGNPLLDGEGLPSAVFAETLFGIAGIELTPGLATASTCPEAIWQAAKWWASFYEETRSLAVENHARTIVPEGWFFLRQPAASIRPAERRERKFE
jgi:hypothetical protein